MVGTAVYQVTLLSLISAQKEEAENRPAPGRTAAPPEARVDSRAAINPWTWNKGITIRVRSDGVSSYVAMMCLMEDARFFCVSGTPLGRLVVPEVCRKSASSPSSGFGPAPS